MANTKAFAKRHAAAGNVGKRVEETYEKAVDLLFTAIKRHVRAARMPRASARVKQTNYIAAYTLADGLIGLVTAFEGKGSDNGEAFTKLRAGIKREAGLR